jgi:hypothetical protein
MNNEEKSKRVKFNIPNFEYSPEKQEEINNQKDFLTLYYKNNYETILNYTGYRDTNNVLKYYTIENALRDYDLLTNEVLFEQRSGYNLYSYLNLILDKRIFRNETDPKKKEKLIESFFTDYEKWKKMLKSKVDIDKRRIEQEEVSKEFADLNSKNDYGYYDTNFEGGRRKYKRKTRKTKRRKTSKTKRRKTSKTKRRKTKINRRK